MTKLRSLAAASALAALAGIGAPGTAHALPAGVANATPPAAIEAAKDAAPVHHWHRRCWPVYRWVWTYHGWRHVYVGSRCAYPHYRPYWH